MKASGQVLNNIISNLLFVKPDIWVGDEDCLWLNVFTRFVSEIHHHFQDYAAYFFQIVKKR